MLETNILAIPSAESADDGGFLEELSNAQFATYGEVARLSGITTPGLVNEGSGWLRFQLDGKELIVAKKNIRHSVSWNQLSAAGCVSGTKTIEIGGKKYKVRLLGVSNVDPCPNVEGEYMEQSRNSEWDRLFYPIVRDDPYVPSPPKNPNARYSQSDLEMSGGLRYSWGRERHAGHSTWRTMRCYRACSSLNAMSTDVTDTRLGWRPCLELIQ